MLQERALSLEKGKAEGYSSMREAKLAPTLLTVTHFNKQNKPIQIPPRQTAGRVLPVWHVNHVAHMCGLITYYPGKKTGK